MVIDNGKTKQTQEVTGCLANRFQNGDLDYDGIPYQKGSWPNGGPDTPTSARYVGPFTLGHPYPQIQFETDAPGSEFLCNVVTGANCTVPPLGGAKFYPYWTMNNPQRLPGVKLPAGTCVWNFGNTIAGVTKQTFGKDLQYGAPDLAVYGGTSISPVLMNPEFSGKCPVFNHP